MWMTLLKVLCLAVTTRCLPSHVCNPKGQGWTEMVITPSVDSRAGFIQTQGFPRDIPKTPFRCRWIINNTEMYARHQNWKKNSKNLIRSGDESWILYIYFTQLYIKEEMVTVRECYDFNCNNVTVEFNKKIDDKKGLFNTQQTAVWSWLPFVHIELEVLDRRGAHMRVMEVNDAYGLNITWAVAKEHRLQGFSSCSLVECSFNGECLAYADHSGNALASMACHCSSPAGVDHVNTFNTPFYGDKCQFHNKHGYCTGPGDGHADAKQRCNGHGCKYVTSRYVVCECREGYSGRRCETKIDEHQDENTTCYRNVAYNLSLILDKPPSNESLGRIEEFWNEACKDVCKVHSLSHLQLEFSVLIVVSGQEDVIKSTIELIKSRRKVFNLKVKKLQINSIVRICIDSLEVNQSNSLHEKQEFSLTCVVKVNGSFTSWTEVAKSMLFTWYKDDLLVNTTVAQRFVKQVKFNINTTVASILTVADASQWDSGLFRCDVSYQGLEVTRSLERKLKVTESPVVEIWPRMLILIRDGTKIVTPRNASTIYCVSGKDGNTGSEYKFSWTRRRITELPEEDTLIDFSEGPEEEEDIKLPNGSLLRLDNIGAITGGYGFIYTCVVHNTLNSEMDTELSVPVYVMTGEEARTSVCERWEAKDLIWPLTLVGHSYHHLCHPGFQGTQSRTCNSLGQTPMWSDTVDQDSCVRNALANIKDGFQEFTEGYISTDGRDQVVQVFQSLEEETRKSFRPRPAEWHLILSLMTDVIAYLHSMDRKLASKAPSDAWIMKILPANLSISHIVTTLITIAPGDRIVRESTPEIVSLIRSVSLLVARKMAAKVARRWPAVRPSCPPLTVSLGRIDRSDKGSELVIDDLEGSKKDDEQFCPMVDKSVEVSVGVSKNGTGSKNGNVSVIVIHYRNLYNMISKSADNAGTHKILYVLNSNILTIAMESAVEVGGSLVDYRPLHHLPPDIYFKISFSYLNSSFNSSQVSLICASAPSTLLTDKVAPKEGWQWNLESGCRLRLENDSNRPECWCKNTGTFGLLVAREEMKELTAQLEGISESIMFGCIIGIGLSSLTLLLVVRSCLYSRVSAIMLLKLQTTVSVTVSLILFVLTTNQVVPRYSYSFVCSCLQVVLLTALSAQVSKSAVIHCDLEPNLDPKLVKPYIFVFALGVPVLLVSGVAICSDAKGSNYWVSLPVHLAVYLLASFLFLLLYILLAVKTLGHLYSYKSQSQADSSKFRGYEANIRIINRSLVITAGLVNLNLFSILYVNLPEAAYIIEWFFSVAAALIGVFLFTCYTVNFESESFVGIWCDFDKDNPYGVGREVRLKEERREGSMSIGSGSRKRRRSACSNCRGSGCKNGCTSPLIQSSGGHKLPSPDTSSETSHSLNFPKQRMSPSDIQELARQSSMSSGDNTCAATIQGSCTRCLNHVPEFKKPARAKCILRDNYEALSATPSKSPPESLSEVIERMKKPTCLPPLMESPPNHKPQEYKGSSSSDGLTNSRRSTMTSNMTMVTSSDMSEYVQQEPTSPDKKLSRYRTCQPSPCLRKPLSPSHLQSLRLISPPPLKDPLTRLVVHQQTLLKPSPTISESTPTPVDLRPGVDPTVPGPASWLRSPASKAASLYNSLKQTSPESASPYNSIKQTSPEAASSYNSLKQTSPEATSPYNSFKPTSPAKPLPYISSAPQIMALDSCVLPMTPCQGCTPPPTPVKTSHNPRLVPRTPPTTHNCQTLLGTLGTPPSTPVLACHNPHTLRASHSKSLSHLKLVTPFGSCKEPIYVNNNRSIYVPGTQFKVPATAPLSRVGATNKTSSKLRRQDEFFDPRDANDLSFDCEGRDSLNPKNFAPNEFQSISDCSLLGTGRSVPAAGGLAANKMMEVKSIPGSSADVSCSKSSSFVSTPTSRTGPYDTLLLLHSVGEKLKMDNYHIKDQDKVDTAVSITHDQRDARPGQEWMKSANRV